MEGTGLVKKKKGKKAKPSRRGRGTVLKRGKGKKPTKWKGKPTRGRSKEVLGVKPSYADHKGEKRTKFCRYCGAKIPRASKYCEECGGQLQFPLEMPKCASCGMEIPYPTAKFCAKCGAKLA